jgi:hypothetical protein
MLWNDGTGLRPRLASGFEACGQAVLRRDFLSPLLLGLLVRDAMPLPWIPGRADALERAWEQSRRDTFSDPGEGLATAIRSGTGRIIPVSRACAERRLPSHRH